MQLVLEGLITLGQLLLLKVEEFTLKERIISLEKNWTGFSDSLDNLKHIEIISDLLHISQDSRSSCPAEDEADSCKCAVSKEIKFTINVI